MSQRFSELKVAAAVVILVNFQISYWKLDCGFRSLEILYLLEMSTTYTLPNVVCSSLTGFPKKPVPKFNH